MPRIDEVEVAIGKRFGALESTAQVFDDWKSKMDGAMEDMHVENGALRKQVNRMVLD